LPNDFRENHVELATGKIHVLEGGSGSSILFLHHSWGNPGWLPVHTVLSKGHRVVVPDMPGWGGSERPIWARDPRDIAILCSRLIEALELESVTLVGPGFGGYVAAELATIFPDGLQGLVLIGAAGLKPKNNDILDQMLASHRDYIEASFRDLDTYVAWMGEEPADDMRQLWESSREMTARVCWKPYMFNRRLAPLLADVKIPTLIVWGSEDKVIPLECADLYSMALPNATLQVIEGAGHLVEMEEGDLVAKLIGTHLKHLGI
jgi:pimeloyl-ACP methyl ester carboxylesterase